MKTYRKRSRGNVIFLIVAFALVIILLGVAFTQLGVFVGGARELTGSVDAKTLNVGKNAVKTAVTLEQGDESQFAEFASNKNEISLVEVNRVLAKGLLAHINNAAMEHQGLSTTESHIHADELVTAAESIAGRLADKLQDPKHLHPYFTDIVSSVPMLGTASVEIDQTGWASGFVDRGEESNIAVDAHQIPEGFTFATLETTHGSDGKSYFKGYTPLKAGEREVCLVPFRVNEQPHLVSGRTFEDSHKPVGNWAKPVPNAFSCQGKAQTERTLRQARAFVIANPQKTFPLSMGHAFVRLKFEDNAAHWIINGTKTTQAQQQLLQQQRQQLQQQIQQLQNQLQQIASGLNQPRNSLIGDAGSGFLGNRGGSFGGPNSPGFGSNGAGIISDNSGGIISDNGAGIISDHSGGIISDNGGGIISDNGGGIISDNGAGIISDNGAGIISDNGGGLVSNSGGGLGAPRYGLQSLGGNPRPNPNQNNQNSQMNQIQQQIQQLQQQLQQEEQARPLNPDSTYGFAPESQDRSYPVGNGNLNVKAALGNEYLPPTLFEAICALGGDYSAMNKVLLQRIHEIKPDFSDDALVPLLKSSPFSNGVKEYFIFIDSANNISIAPKNHVAEQVTWLHPDTKADGGEKQICTDRKHDGPNKVTVQGTGSVKPQHSWCDCIGSIYWRPGTGYDGCLGEVRIARQTEIYANGN